MSPVFSNSIYHNLQDFFVLNPKIHLDLEYLALSTVVQSFPKEHVVRPVLDSLSLLDLCLMNGVEYNPKSLVEVSASKITSKGWPVSTQDFNENTLEPGCYGESDVHKNSLQAYLVASGINPWMNKAADDVFGETPRSVALAMITDNSELLGQMLKLPGAPSLKELLESPFEGAALPYGLGKKSSNWWRFLLSYVSPKKEFSNNIVTMALESGLKPEQVGRDSHPCMFASYQAVEKLLSFDAFPKDGKFIKAWIEKTSTNSQWISLHSTENVKGLIGSVQKHADYKESDLDSVEFDFIFKKFRDGFWKESKSAYDVAANSMLEEFKGLSLEQLRDEKRVLDGRLGEWNLLSLPVLYLFECLCRGNFDSFVSPAELVGILDHPDVTFENYNDFRSVAVGDGSFSFGTLFDLVKVRSNQKSISYTATYDVVVKEEEVMSDESLACIRFLSTYQKKDFSSSKRIDVVKGLLSISAEYKKSELAQLEMLEEYLRLVCASSSAEIKENNADIRFILGRFPELPAVGSQKWVDKLMEIKNSRVLQRLNVLQVFLSDSSGQNSRYSKALNESNYALIREVFSNNFENVSDLVQQFNVFEAKASGSRSNKFILDVMNEVIINLKLKSSSKEFKPSRF